MKATARRDSLFGFTLVELLITVSIIAVLLAAFVNVMLGVQRGSRDSKRKVDLKTVQSALEQYRADQHFYPASLTPGETLQSPDGSKTYLKVIPSDPSLSVGYNNYCYDRLTGSQRYELSANLESAPLNNPPCPGYTCSGRCYNFQVTSP